MPAILQSDRKGNKLASVLMSNTMIVGQHST